MVWGSGGFKSCESLLNRVEANDGQLVELVILPMKTFGENDVKRLSSIIKSGKNTTLKSISASGHAISKNSLSTFGEAIASQQNCSTGITSIAIGDENMGDEGIISFCTPLKDANGGLLQMVDFAFKSISQSGAEMIGTVFGSSENLEKLILYRNETIGDEGLIALCNAAVAPSSSSTSPTSLTSPFPALNYLDLSECNIGEEGIKSLVASFVGNGQNKNQSDKVHNLIELNLNSNPIGSLSCNHLQQLISYSIYGHSKLKSLSLKNCSIGDEGIQILADAFLLNQSSCAGLTSIDLSNNGITTKGMIPFAGALKDGKHSIPDLNEIIFADNNLIGEDGICALANALNQRSTSNKEQSKENNATLHKLDLTNTDCGSNGAVELMKCTSLSTLRLFNNNLGCTGMEALSTQLIGGHPHLEHLDLGGNRAKGDVVAKLLEAIMQDQSNFKNVLKTLELGGNENNDESLFAAARKKRPEMDIAPVKETPKDAPVDDEEIA